MTTAWPQSKIPSKRAHHPSTTVMEPSIDPLARNRIIVSTSDEMLALPGEMTEQRRSGTWATIRFARKHGTPMKIIYPDGSMGS